MKLLLVLFGTTMLIGCTAEKLPPQPVVETKVTPVCEYGGQISGNTVVCNARFTPMPSAMMYSVGKIMFDNKTKQDCWAGQDGGRGGDAVNLPTCSSLGN
jgi:hypothetical protein